MIEYAAGIADGWVLACDSLTEAQEIAGHLGTKVYVSDGERQFQLVE